MKLHIGGHQVKEGWKILNIQPFAGVDFIGDISDLGQFEDRSIDAIYASHVLEHVPAAAILKTLEGIYRVLRRGGQFMVSVPDVDALFPAILNPEMPMDYKLRFTSMVFGGQTDAHDIHYFGWNFQFMQHFCEEVGFMRVERVEAFGLFQDNSDYRPLGFPISLNAIATK